ncbi:carboxypeptidase-like regulatory domain-containing protein [Planctomicrobium sp. SH668]|uniref:carboxypeptidase-like regulatory domain-containing protein n=1 Tax=Planctomicrobium sp. SH668 TaxID=3448126 RepID=UPI003F5C14D1
MNQWIKQSFLIITICFTGCSQGLNDQPELGEVVGTITYEGKPLSGASITFIPVDGRPASGKADAEGKYELTYIRTTKGCKIGKSKVEITTGKEGEDEIEQEGDDYVQKPTKGGPPSIPAKYNVMTELTADVLAGKNTIDFDLKK